MRAETEILLLQRLIIMMCLTKSQCEIKISTLCPSCWSIHSGKGNMKMMCRKSDTINLAFYRDNFWHSVGVESLTWVQ